MSMAAITENASVQVQDGPFAGCIGQVTAGKGLHTWTVVSRLHGIIGSYYAEDLKLTTEIEEHGRQSLTIMAARRALAAVPLDDAKDQLLYAQTLAMISMAESSYIQSLV